VVVSASSSSPLDITAWLADSSISESSSDSFSDCREIALGVLGIPEVGNGEGASTLSGMRGVVLAWLESFLFSLRVGDNLELSGRFPELADELCDPDRDTTLSWCLGLGWGCSRSACTPWYFLDQTQPQECLSGSALQTNYLPVFQEAAYQRQSPGTAPYPPRSS
jgi:hypothetical protein